MKEWIEFDGVMATQFEANGWKISATLCGMVDIATPKKTFTVSIEDADALIVCLKSARNEAVAARKGDRKLISRKTETYRREHGL